MTLAPFQQLAFEDLPDEPPIPHGFFDLPERRVPVWSDAFGDTEASVRVVGTGPPLLLLHGLMTTGYSWRYAWSHLAEHRTLYIPDLVGCGRSSKPDRRYTAGDVVDWTAHLVEALGIRGCEVIGNSMGGYLAMRLVLAHPGLHERVMVVHAPGPPTPRIWALWCASWLPGVEQLVAWWVRRDPLRWAHRNVHYWDESLKSLEEAREYGDPLATAEGAAAFVRILVDVMNARELRAFVHSLQARREEGCGFPADLSLVYARQDPMVPPAVGHRLGALLPEADLQWMSEASHFAHVDAAERFAAIAVRWLSEG